MGRHARFGSKSRIITVIKFAFRRAKTVIDDYYEQRGFIVLPVDRSPLAEPSNEHNDHQAAICFVARK